MKFQITFDRDEDGIWRVECPAIPGCISQGPTQAEALANIREAIRHYVKFQSALIESICYGGENRISHNVYCIVLRSQGGTWDAVDD